MTARTKTTALAVLFLAHGAITARAMLDHGYFELFAFPFTNWPAGQIFSDLTTSLLLVTSWLVADARRTGRTAWPWIVATLALGSFGPLGYLLTGQAASPSTPQ